MNLKPADLIAKYYAHSADAHRLLLAHSRQVTRKALTIARRLTAGGTNIDLEFVAQAAMLHDIGMIFTNAPDLYCFGDLPYLAHGIKGHEILCFEGYPKHARVCERHTGIGLTATEIIVQKLPLPARDMLPETLEEQIICYADLFFSKNPSDRDREKTPAEVRSALVHYGEEKGLIFERWQQRFEPQSAQRKA